MSSGIYKRTEKIRQKLSESHKGQIPWCKGKHLSENHKIHLSRSLKGRKMWNRGLHIRLSPQGEFKKGHITWNKGKKWKWMSELKRGEKNPNWNGGKSFEPYTLDWTETLRRAIRERDNYICQLCSQYGNAVHHIDYDKKNCDPKNLITLCKKCNSKVNFNRNYWIKLFNKKHET